MCPMHCRAPSHVSPPEVRSSSESGSCTPPRRPLLPRQIGETLERLYTDDIEPRLSELAHHFYESAASGVAEKAIEYCARAGDAAMTSIAYEQAALHYERALSLAEHARA